MRNLPPATALRAFEAADRHLNYSRAAQDLNVTHAAISQQIRNLEEWFGLQLFMREGKAMALTEAGQLFAQDVVRAFDLVEEATKRTLGLEDSRPVKITTTVVFASRWLMPRLGQFHGLYPDTRINLDTTMNLVDYRRDTIDLGIRYGNGSWPGLEASLLVRGDRVPMCAPSLLGAGKELKTPADILNFPIIHDVDHTEWEQWFRQHGMEDVDMERGMVHTLSTLAYQAALEGHGILLGVERMARDDIAAGRLVMPFGSRSDSAVGYYLTLPEGRSLRPRARDFKNWLIQVAEGENT